jgi:hypothetical protein
MTEHKGGAPPETDPDPSKHTSTSTTKSGTAITESHFCPSQVVVWKNFKTDISDRALDRKVKKKNGFDPDTVKVRLKFIREPGNEDEMVDNYFATMSSLADICTKEELVELLVPFDLALERKVKYGDVQSRPDLLVGVLSQTEDGKIMNPWLVAEAKAEDVWPTTPERLWDSLPDLWKCMPSTAMYSFEQKPMVQLTTHMAASKKSCGLLFNGIVAHFCKLDKNLKLASIGPFDMQSPEFWMSLLKFIKYAKAQKPLEVPIELKAAAAATGGAQDDDVDDADADTVQVPGPGVGSEYDWEGVQPLFCGGGDRPEVWIIRPEQGQGQGQGGRVVVKAVDHAEDPECTLRSEIAREVDVYNALRSKSNVIEQDFIPELVASGKLPGVPRSGIVTRYAGASINRWEPKDKAEAIEVRDKAIGALKRLHEHGFMHGDVALRNFVIDEESKKVRVIDLGRASEIHAETKPELEIECVEEDFREAFPQYFAAQE